MQDLLWNASSSYFHAFTNDAQGAQYPDALMSDCLYGALLAEVYGLVRTRLAASMELRHVPLMESPPPAGLDRQHFAACATSRA